MKKEDINDISHLTLPDNFHTIIDFFLPADKPTFGIFYSEGKVGTIYDEKYLHDFAKHVVETTKKLNLDKNFNLEFIHNKKRIILRGHSIESTQGKVYVYRRLPSYIPKLEELGLPNSITEILFSERLSQGGLIIIAGETGQGKSTTAGSLISYRLRNGAFCLSIEDPIELPLQGFHINDEDPSIRGVCFQSHTTEENLLDNIKSALRCYPSIGNSILFLGETRDAQTAYEVLKAAANGHLVVTTFHGADVLNSLRRFISLACGANGAVEADVRQLFSSVFRLIIHQRLDLTIDGKKRIRPSILFSKAHNSQVANRLRTGTNIDLLSSELSQQNQAVQQDKSVLNM